MHSGKISEDSELRNRFGMELRVLRRTQTNQTQSNKQKKSNQAIAVLGRTSGDA